MFKSIDAQNAACNAVTRLVDLGSDQSSGSLNIYGWDASTVLAILPLPLPAFQDATDGTAVSNLISDSTTILDGTASFFGVLNRDASTVWTGTISDMTGTGDLKLNSIYLAQDSSITITSMIYIVPPEFNYFGAPGATGIQGVTGPAGGGSGTGIGIQGETGVQGATGVGGGSGGATGIQGATGIRGVTGPAGSGGTGAGIQHATELPLGLPSGGFTPGIFPWDASTMTNPALDEVNALLLAIAPTPPGPLAGALTLSNSTKYSAILPTGLDSSAWYQDSQVAGSTITDYIIDNTYNLTSPNTSTAFKVGSTFGGDDGTVVHVLDMAYEHSRPVSAGVGVTGDLEITDISTYNTIWRKCNARINYTQVDEGFKRHNLLYQTATLQITSDTKVWYDDVNGVPGFPADATIIQNTLSSSRYLSGVQYYGLTDTFDMTSSVTNIANKSIRPVNPVSYSMPALASVSIAIPGASFAYDGTYNFAVTDALDTANVYSIDARLTIVATKPAGTTASKVTASQNRLVNSYSTTYSTNGNITMFDEGYRWQLSNDFSVIPANYANPTGDWTSSAALSNGNGQLYNSTWYYPSINYTSGYLPVQIVNYSIFSGDQVIVWATNIGVAHSSMQIVFTGINYTDIMPSGTGNLNVEVRLPVETNWLDCGRSFGDGNGCRNDGGSSGTTLALTFGTSTSTNSNGVVFIRVTLRNTSAAKASAMVITGT